MFGPCLRKAVCVCVFFSIIFSTSELAFLFVKTDSFVCTVSIHCAPEMSEIDCIGRIESFWPKFVRGW